MVNMHRCKAKNGLAQNKDALHEGEAQSKTKWPKCNAIEHFKLAVWYAGYDLEEVRQAHANAGRHIREAACCVALALLRLARGGL